MWCQALNTKVYIPLMMYIHILGSAWSDYMPMFAYQFKFNYICHVHVHVHVQLYDQESRCGVKH